MITEKVHELIRSRKSVYPKQYIDKKISKEILEEILESANWAPTHKLTEPWRFKVFHGASQKKLGTFMAEKYRAITPLDDFSLVRYEKLKTNPQKAGCVLGICFQRDHEERIPEWEEIASTACAVQNIWLAASVHGIGGYWSTPEAMDHFSELIPLNKGEKCIGLFYMGYFEPFDSNRKRGNIGDKLTWV
ncbi:MAG: nitroreductase [Cytophagales bacterium]|nr:nitroreductase [Cytophagales bacterium]